MAAFDESCFGKVYGELTIIGRGRKTKVGTNVICRCSCGTIKEIRIQDLRRGSTVSCGCTRKFNRVHYTHGLRYHPLYGVWLGIKKRCLNKNSCAYKDYGGRGITICEEWLNDFVPFYNWAIENGWEKGLELDKDKLSPDGNGLIYSPQFCCFLTPKENGRHKRNNVLVVYNGESKPVSEWCEILGLNKCYIYQRGKSKVSAQEAFDKLCSRNKLNGVSNNI